MWVRERVLDDEKNMPYSGGFGSYPGNRVCVCGEEDDEGGVRGYTKELRHKPLFLFGLHPCFREF